MKYLLFIFISLLILSCRSNPNEIIIPEDELVALLVDLHITDAISTNSMVRRQFGEMDSSLIYLPVFDKHGYTRADMTRSLTHYSTNTNKVKRIYDEVHSQLSIQSEETRKLMRQTSLSATKRIWKSNKNRYRIVGDTVAYPPSFDFSIDTTGKFVLDAEIRMDESDESINPLMIAYFYNPLADVSDERIYFDTVFINKSRTMRYYTLVTENRDSTLNRVKILLPVQQNTDSVFKKNMDVRNLVLSLMDESKD